METTEETDAITGLLLEEQTQQQEAAAKAAADDEAKAAADAAAKQQQPAQINLPPELIQQAQVFAEKYLGSSAASATALQALVEKLSKTESAPLSKEEREEQVKAFTVKFFSDPEKTLKEIAAANAPTQQQQAKIPDEMLDPIYEKDGARTIREFLNERKAVMPQKLFEGVEKNFKILAKETGWAEGKSTEYVLGRATPEAAEKVLTRIFETALGKHTMETYGKKIQDIVVKTGNGSIGNVIGAHGMSDSRVKRAEEMARFASMDSSGKVDEATYKRYLASALEE